MKNSRILNSNIISVLSRLGHGDMIAVTDNGFPFPLKGRTEPIDVAVTKNRPGFLEIVQLLMEECYIESVIIAEETRELTSENHEGLLRIINENSTNNEPTDIRYMPHSEFKDLILHGAERGEPVLSMIRTGEFTPFSNIILIAGVPFG